NNIAMRFFLIFFLLFAFVLPAFAAQKLFLVGPQSNLRLLDPGDVPRTVKDYANVYFRNCVAANGEEALGEYVETQCACTAARMQEVMSYEQISSLFDPYARDSYAYSRMI